MRDAVTDERELAQNDERAQGRAETADEQRRHERSLHEVVLERSGERVDHRSAWTIVAVSVSSIET